MSKHWIEDIEENFVARGDRGTERADRAFHDVMLRRRSSPWHPIWMAPRNRDLELRVVEERETTTLPFRCRQVNEGEWINGDRGVRATIRPVSWRVGQHGM